MSAGRQRDWGVGELARAGAQPVEELSHLVALAAQCAAQRGALVRRLQYEEGDVDKGVEYLQTLGVRYYLAYSPS